MLAGYAGGGRIDDAAVSFGAAEGDEMCAVAVGFFGAYAGDGEEFGDGLGAGDGEVVEDASEKTMKAGLPVLAASALRQARRVASSAFWRRCRAAVVCSRSALQVTSGGFGLVLVGFLAWRRCGAVASSRRMIGCGRVPVRRLRGLRG